MTKGVRASAGLPSDADLMAAGARRVERVGDAVLILGDCRAIAPMLPRPDAIVSDPPYGVAERTMRAAAGRGKLAACNDFPAVFGDDEPFDPAAWVGLAPQLILWGGNHFASRCPDASCWLIWDKRDGVPSDDNADCEIAWTNLRGPARVLPLLWKGMIKATERDACRVHPTQKPVAVMEWCLERAALQPSALVLDPYMGSGTTGVACLRRGVRFVGIEIEERYFDVACRRIAEAARQPSLFHEPAQPKAEQLALGYPVEQMG